MSTPSPDSPLEAAIVAVGTAAFAQGEFVALRKTPPAFPGVELAGHFLKHADEQTIVALEAVRRAAERFELDTRDHERWAIVAAPKFVGRLAGVQILERFAKSGGSGVPPHAVAQNSLHSVSGAVSIALGIHGPNVGLGGGPWAMADGLTAALTLFDTARIPGIWLLLTQFDPEPTPDEQGRPLAGTTCHAVALALMPGAAGNSRLSLYPGSAGRELSRDKPTLDKPTLDKRPEPSVAEVAACVESAERGLATRWSCWLPWGGRIELRLAAAEQTLRRAA
ncbi:MAG: hypothetical protein WD872_02170 [Pirellulaceae bacterium]